MTLHVRSWTPNAFIFNIVYAEHEKYLHVKFCSEEKVCNNLLKIYSQSFLFISRENKNAWLAFIISFEKKLKKTNHNGWKYVKFDKHINMLQLNNI